MKLYRPQTELTPQQEMHLNVDHGLDTVEIDEDDLTEIIIGWSDEYGSSYEDLARAIINHITEQE